MAESKSTTTKSTKAADENEALAGAESDQKGSVEGAKAAAKLANDQADTEGGIDHNVVTPTETNDGAPEVGASFVNDDWSVRVGESGNGLPLLQVSRNGWVGAQQIETHVNLLDSLIEALQGVKKAKSDDSKLEYEIVDKPDGTVGTQPKTPFEDDRGHK